MGIISIKSQLNSIRGELTDSFFVFFSFCLCLLLSFGGKITWQSLTEHEFVQSSSESLSVRLYGESQRLSSFGKSSDKLIESGSSFFGSVSSTGSSGRGIEAEFPMESESVIGFSIS